ncbi:hypothetical protein Tco_1401786 [Tanacetum coccineum]
MLFLSVLVSMLVGPMFFVDHTTILAAEDACLPAPTPDEKEPFDAIKKIDSQNFQSWVECSLKYLVWSFGPVRSFDLVWSFDLVRIFDLPMHVSVAQGGFCLFSLKDFPFVLIPLDVVEDALAQGADGLGLMKNEDHQVLKNKQKLEEDASDCARVDDDGV